VVAAINDLYCGELRLWLNLYLPSVKLVKKVRVGAKVRAFMVLPKHPGSASWRVGRGMRRG
jgi:hypothetical protein